MKTLGIVGGIGPESTIIYYRSIIREYRQRRPGAGDPSILINSIDNGRLLSLVKDGRLDELVDYLLQALKRLVNGGADFAFVAANTPHLVFDQLRETTPISLVSVIEATGAAAQSLGLRRLGLFGTRFTMSGGFYAKVLGTRSMTLVEPNETEQAYIHDKYMTELLKGTVSPETRAELIRIAKALTIREQIDGVILGGTELSLVFPADSKEATPVPFLDTTDIHTKAAVAELLKCEEERI